ncbi:MAG: sialate O-acetylesterase, partial [Verrucomicrobia bacterium]|nr:sialate O-acetylesterase [Cytophagales bacterium]
MMLRLAFMLCFFSVTAFGQIRVARLFGDHCVLQRQKPVPVWGWAEKGKKITLAFNGQQINTKADQTGKWTAILSPMQAGGPFTMSIKGKQKSIVLEDILVGEVWICSGQSNMEWTVSATDNAPTEIRAADFNKIRHFNVAHELSLQPENELKSGDWKVCSQETVGDFTAVGYFFAKEIYQKLGVPVGLVHTSWGGSQIEGWISKEAMLGSEELSEYARNMPTTWEGAFHSLDKRMKKHVFGKDEISVTTEDEKNYLKPDYDFSAWANYTEPGAWDWQGIWAFRGQGYLQKSVEIPTAFVSKQAKLGIGENDSPYQLFINGERISQGQ